MIELSQRLKELREYNHYTQEYVSSKVNIERPSYSNYELGKRTPSIDVLIAFADFYQISLDDLLRNPDFSPCAATTEDRLYHPLPKDEKFLLSIYRNFPVEGKRDVLEYVQFKKKRMNNP